MGFEQVATIAGALGVIVGAVLAFGRGASDTKAAFDAKLKSRNAELDEITEKLLRRQAESEEQCQEDLKTEKANRKRQVAALQRRVRALEMSASKTHRQR